MQASDSSDGDQVATDQPTQSTVDLLWGFHVGDIVQLVQGVSKQQSYALYCGQGRVIHAWTPSRQSFRVRVDSLRELKLAGYSAKLTTVLDEFFLNLLNLTPLESKLSIQRAKTALHATTACRFSNVSFILFAKFGDHIFTVLELLKEAYRIALDAWAVSGLSVSPENPDVPESESPLDTPARIIKRVDNSDATTAPSTEPAIKLFLGTNGELLMSEWLGRTLAEFVVDPPKRSESYTISMPAATNRLTPLSLKYDKNDASFQLECYIAHELSERMAADHMECGVCCSDFAPLRVMLMKCSHYLCEPCLQLLPHKKCPYCRAPIRSPHEISALVKREALQIMMKELDLKNDSTIATIKQETMKNNDEHKHEN